MSPGGSITTTNATATAARINVNAAGGGTGGAAVGSVAVGSGGGITRGDRYGWQCHGRIHHATGAADSSTRAPAR